MVVADPEERLDEGNDTDIEKSAFGNNMKNCSLSITPPDLSITEFSLPEYADVGEMVGITAEIMNNETVQANSTLWWVVEGNEPIRANFTYPDTWDSWSATYPGGIMMRAHFEHLEFSGRAYGSYFNVSVDDKQVYYKEDYEGANEPPFWTRWELGSTIEVSTVVGYTTGGGDPGHANFTIDKYQVLIDGRIITLDANEQKSCSVIWNATVRPGNYTVRADVDDQNMSAAMFVNGTDLAVTDLAVPDEVFDGDGVSIDVTITNLGQTDAGGFLVDITDHWTDCKSYGEPVAERYVSGLEVGDSTSISVPWTASLKSSNYIAHNHIIRVVVTPDDGLRELNLENNNCLLYTSPSPRDVEESRMPSSA